MGVDVITCAILGIQIKIDKLQTTKTTRACSCKVEGIEKMKFCPNCGKRAMKTETSDIEGFDYEGETLCDYPLFIDREQGMIYVGTRTKDIDPMRGKEFAAAPVPDDVKAYKEKMRDTLGPLGLWNEKKFGMWVAGWVSY